MTGATGKAGGWRRVRAADNGRSPSAERSPTTGPAGRKGML